MKVLFLHPNIPDYVGDGLFHGLYSMSGQEVIDFPRMDYMYEDYPAERWKGVGNEGKTLYGKLKDTHERQNLRASAWQTVESFDLIVINKPQGFRNRIVQLYSYLKEKSSLHKLVWVDGSDYPSVFPYQYFSQTLTQFPKTLFWPMHRWPYFKREFNSTRFAAPLLLGKLTSGYHIYPVSISIPADYIDFSGLKTKLFPGYIVDREIAENLKIDYGGLGKRMFTFNSEQDYVEDVKSSKFGITTKRAGWDTLRHYEYAAKGAVLCFRNIHHKPHRTAPHGLDESNSIAYKNWHELQDKIKRLDETAYQRLRENTFTWINEHTTIAEAGRFLAACKSFSELQMFNESLGHHTHV